MPSVNDWAAKAARIIRGECNDREYMRLAPEYVEERIAAIIALHAAPLVALLMESRRAHSDGEDIDCPMSYEARSPGDECICGADEWNARVDAALRGEERP